MATPVKIRIDTKQIAKETPHPATLSNSCSVASVSDNCFEYEEFSMYNQAGCQVTTKFVQLQKHLMPLIK